MAKKPLINRQIKCPQVLLIDQESTNHGLMDTRDALQLAENAGLDLVVVSQTEDAPVAKILDFGKHRYKQKKRQQQGSKSNPTVKEVKLRPNVGESDYGIRINRAMQWLSKGDSVKFQIRLRGREHQHRDRAGELLERVATDLGEAAKVQTFDKRSLVAQFIPA